MTNYPFVLASCARYYKRLTIKDLQLTFYQTFVIFGTWGWVLKFEILLTLAHTPSISNEWIFYKHLILFRVYTPKYTWHECKNKIIRYVNLRIVVLRWPLRSVGLLFIDYNPNLLKGWYKSRYKNWCSYFIFPSCVGCSLCWS